MDKTKKLGFWMKLLALWLNALLVFFMLKLFFYLCLALPLYLYFPFEFTFIVALIIYLVIFKILKRKTFGKYLLTLNVPKSLTKTIKWGAAISLIFFLICPIINGVLIWKDYKEISLTTPVEHPFIKKDRNILTDVSSLSEQDYSVLSSWIEECGKPAEDYVIEIAQTYKVTILGEEHGVKNNLDFFNEIIPSLYYKSGVRCIAMECIPSTMNHKIEKLINSTDFDEKLWIEISRSQGWFSWGMEEYWNVLKTAWQLNKNLQSNEQKIRVVGIDSEWDGPNFALSISSGDDGLPNISFVEKFRVFSLIPDFIKLAKRDEIMARNIEKEAIEKNDKCVVLVGANHSFINYGQGFFDSERNTFRCNNRMGVMLSQKYKNDIFQIVFHMSDRLSDQVLNNVVFEKNLAPVGFTVENSPFAKLRDNTQYLYLNFPTASFSDIAQGYICLVPSDKKELCRWVPDYITKEMFMKYKPFYEGKWCRKFKNNEEVNAFLIETLTRN